MDSLSREKKEWDTRPVEETRKLINQLGDMCLAHDHSHEMSDDYTAYKRGRDSLFTIKQFVRENQIPPKVACIIFNREAIRKHPSYAHLFWIKEEDFG